MSITKHFSSPQEYFENCIHFLHKYSWIYESANTCFIRMKVLEKFPPEWIEYFTTISLRDLNAFPDRIIRTNILSLDEFLRDIDKLTPIQQQTEYQNIDYNFKKMSPKKQHEVVILSSLIQTTIANEIDVIVDIGSGLGYLSEVLYKRKPCRIIGLEADPYRVETSVKRQKEIYPDSINEVIFKQHFVTSESKEFILSEAKKLCPKPENIKIGIIGLHACADLTINAMKLFLQMESVKKLIIMPCCYHKLELDTEVKGCRFRNFPLSDVLKKTSATFQGLNRPFLRLACQQTSGKWKQLTEEDHYRHSVAMFLRAAVEAILADEEMVIKFNSKKVEQHLNLSDWFRIGELRSKINGTSLPWTSKHFEKFTELLKLYPSGLQLSEALTCLQTTMQKLCENVILYDQVCFMEEQAAKENIGLSIKFEKIMDDLLSPRCSALIAQKF